MGHVKRTSKKARKFSRSKETQKVKRQTFCRLPYPKKPRKFRTKNFSVREKKKKLSLTPSHYPLSRPGAESDSFRSFKEFDGIIFIGFFISSNNLTSTNNNLLRV